MTHTARCSLPLHPLQHVLFKKAYQSISEMFFSVIKTTRVRSRQSKKWPGCRLLFSLEYWLQPYINLYMGNALFMELQLFYKSQRNSKMSRVNITAF